MSPSSASDSTAVSGLDLAAERAQVRGERVRDSLRAAARERPADGMAEQPEHEAEGRARRAVEPQHRVGREAREEAARLLAAKGHPGERRRRRSGPHAEAGERDRVRGNVERPEEVLEQRLGIAGERCEESPPASVVLAQRRHLRVRRALEQRCGPVVERMRERRGRLDPLDAVLRERQRAEERRRDAERVDRRADVVHEARAA